MRVAVRGMALALTVSLGIVSVGISQSTSLADAATPADKNCNHGCTWKKDEITYTVPNRTIAVAPTTTVSPTTTTTVKPYVAPVVVPKAPTTTAPKPVNGNPYGVTAADVVAWTRVAICEQGGNWYVRGSMYSGGLGISNYNWSYYSRSMGVPASAADATPIQQIAVAKRINAGYQVPDQHGCAAW